MKKVLVFVLVLAAIGLAAITGFVNGRDSNKSVGTVDVIDILPTPTPEVDPMYAAHLWLPSHDENINVLFDETDIGHTANTKCGYPSEQIGFVFKGEDIYDESVSELYPDGVYVDCKTYRLWQAVREFGTDGNIVEDEVAEATATPAPTASPEAETVMAPVIAAEEPLALLYNDACEPEDGPCSFGYGPEGGNGFVVAVGVELSFAEADWEFPGSACEQLLLLDGYMRDATIVDGSYWSYVVDPAVAAADDDTVLEYAIDTSRKWALQQYEDEECTKEIDPENPLAHTWVGWEAEDGWHFMPYTDFRHASGENDTLRFFAHDIVVGWHIGYGDSDNDLCDGGNCYVSDAEQDGWCGGCVVFPWDGEVPAEAVDLSSK